MYKDTPEDKRIDAICKERGLMKKPLKLYVLEAKIAYVSAAKRLVVGVRENGYSGDVLTTGGDLLAAGLKDQVARLEADYEISIIGKSGDVLCWIDSPEDMMTNMYKIVDDYLYSIKRRDAI